MKKTLSVAAVWAVCALPAFACERPTAPTSIPDGKTSSMEEMMAAKKAIDSFKKNMEEYLACEKSSAKQNAAHAELEKVADRFNAEVRAFKAKG